MAKIKSLVMKLFLKFTNIYTFCFFFSQNKWEYSIEAIQLAKNIHTNVPN